MINLPEKLSKFFANVSTNAEATIDLQNDLIRAQDEMITALQNQVARLKELDEANKACIEVRDKMITVERAYYQSLASCMEEIKKAHDRHKILSERTIRTLNLELTGYQRPSSAGGTWLHGHKQ